MKCDRFYLNGQWIKPQGSERIDVVNPATETLIGHVVAGNEADVELAVTAAEAAADSWATTSIEMRTECLRAIAAGINARAEELACLITSEMGMPTSLCRGYQVDPPVMVIDSVLELLNNFPFKRTNKNSVSLLEPVGVCALITPWNYPLTQTMLKLAPALATGCTVVWKPSEVTPLSANIFAEIMDESGLPPGVFNMIHGRGEEVGSGLARHPSVRKISLTGSTRAGVSVASQAANTLKLVTLELGGKSPHIICDDADLEKVVTFNIKKCFSNSGQACDVPTRMLVHQSQYEEAVEISIAVAESLKTGNPTDEATHLGPLVNQTQYQRVVEMIEAGINEGARLVTGGPGRPAGLDKGYYVKPTVFADVDNGMKIAQQEIFGPVLCVLPYKDDVDAINIANDTPYGLAAYVSSSDNQRVSFIARKLKAGQIRINQAPFDITAPFGGYKMSGYGRELGNEGLNEYVQIKACMGLNDS